LSTSSLTDSTTGSAPVFKCFIHEFETQNLEEFSNHCLETGHVESGQTKCADCGEIIYFDAIPYHPHTPQGKNYQIRCEDCFPKFLELHQTVKGRLKKADENENVSYPLPKMASPTIDNPEGKIDNNVVTEGGNNNA
jgi:hypothetical protein